MKRPPKPSDHFDGRRFFNPGAAQAKGFLDLLRWKFSSRPQLSPGFVDDVIQSKPPASVEGSSVRITLVNHSTVLIQFAGVNILTDPVWSERVSPVTFAGPRRRRAPGVRMEDLPRLDIVLLSHNHYDHLDLATLRTLAATQFIVPSGVGPLLRSNNIGPVTELDWNESTSRIHAGPAYHFSARGVFDRNRTLWCGFVIDSPAGPVYFAADTAFGPHFAQIRERFGSPRVALLPIGAYEPRWFMSPVHMGPDEAVRAHEILGAQTSIAIHHGTFQLADEALDEPRRLLKSCAAGDSFLVLNNGEYVTLT